MSSPGDPATRTLLPDEEHRPRPPSRRPMGGVLALVTVVVLLVVAILIARGGGGKPASAPTAAASPGTTLPPAVSTAMPPTGGGDVAVGYPDTSDGAASAASNYVVALGSDTMLNTTRRHAVIARIADPAVAASLQSTYDTATAALEQQWGLSAQGSAPAGFTFVSRLAPFGVSGTAFTADRATVDVYTVSLVGIIGDGPADIPTKPVTEVWNTQHVSLHWADGDWKVVSITATNGPVPVSGVQAASPLSDLAGALQRFGGFRYGA